MAKKKKPTKRSRVRKSSRPPVVKRTSRRNTHSRATTTTQVAEIVPGEAEQGYSEKNLLALRKANSPDEAIAILKAINRVAATPTDEIFGDDPTWYFNGRFGTNAPVELGDYSRTRGLSVLEVKCRDDIYTLIAERNYDYGYMREMLVVLSILNAELEKAGRPDRAYFIIQPSWPATLLLDDRLAAAAKALRKGKQRALSVAELEREYHALSAEGRKIPWVRKRSSKPGRR